MTFWDSHIILILISSFNSAFCQLQGRGILNDVCLMGNGNWPGKKEKDVEGFLAFKNLHFLNFCHLRKPLRRKPILISSEGEEQPGRLLDGQGFLGGYFGVEMLVISQELCGQEWAAAPLNLTFAKNPGTSEPPCCFWESCLVQPGAGVRSLGELGAFVLALFPACHPPHLASWPHQQPALPGGRQSQMTGPTPERLPGFLLPCNQNQMH